jgi:hypothetical protein
MRANRSSYFFAGTGATGAAAAIGVGFTVTPLAFCALM